ncbi:MAG: helix-turn-helix domain-containing protein [Opitutus sp.]
MSDPITVVAPERLAFTAAETCAMLAISDTTLWRLAARGLLRPLRHLRHRMYSKAEIERFLKEGTK